MFADRHPVETEPDVDWHLQALRDAGFSQVGFHLARRERRSGHRRAMTVALHPDEMSRSVPTVRLMAWFNEVLPHSSIGHTFCRSCWRRRTTVASPDSRRSREHAPSTKPGTVNATEEEAS